MKTKTTGLILALCFFGAAVCFGDDPQTGTWKLDKAKSKFAPGAARNQTVVYESTDDSVKVTMDGTDKDGKATHNEWTGKFDGKDYTVAGEPTSDTRSYTKISDRVVKITDKKDGKATVTGRIVVSAGGKFRIATTGEAGARKARAPKTGQYTTNNKR